MAISPSTATVDGKDVTHFTGTSGVWSTDCGDLFTDSGCTTPYAGGAATGVYHRAQNKTSAGTIENTNEGVPVAITITGVYPLDPSYPYEFQPDKRGVISNIKRNGDINGRTLGDGTMKRDVKFSHLNRKRTAFQEFLVFWDYHFPHKKWKFLNKYEDLVHIMQFTGRPQITLQSLQRVNFDVEAREA
jgi:hypothetical protein